MASVIEGQDHKDALRDVEGALKAGYTHVVDADLKGFFDAIPHDRLIARVKARISDGRLVSLLQDWLEQDIMRGMECWGLTAGTPQGAVISLLLANIYLHDLD